MKIPAILCAALLPAVTAFAAEVPKPNVLIINIDDLGYADIGPFGSTLIRTPNLDRMAKEGRKLTSFYGAPVCSPSRAALKGVGSVLELRISLLRDVCRGMETARVMARKARSVFRDDAGIMAASSGWDLQIRRRP